MLACPKRSDASLRWMPACRATVAYARPWSCRLVRACRETAMALWSD